MTDAPLEERFNAGETFADFLTRPHQYRDLWNALYKRATVPDDLLARALQIQKPWHLLVLSEDWCGDSINTLPLVAKLTDAVPMLDLRILGRDANPDLMDTHLTGKSRSIPVIVLLDGSYVERGSWGPRPRPLQEWVTAHMELPKADRYKEVRAWYARDHGVTSLTELLDMIDRAASA
ncbi:MAG: thioredoxin family protein [Gemmatimonadaceae bacterium]